MTPVNRTSIFINFILLYFNLNITNPQDYRFLYKREADRTLWSEKRIVAQEFMTTRPASLCGLI